MKTLLLHSFFSLLDQATTHGWEWLRKTGKDWERLGGAPAGLRDNETAGLRDRGTTGLRDRGTAGLRDYETTKKHRSSQAFSVVLSCAGQLGVRVVQQCRR